MFNSYVQLPEGKCPIQPLRFNFIVAWGTSRNSLGIATGAKDTMGIQRLSFHVATPMPWTIPWFHGRGYQKTPSEVRPFIYPMFQCHSSPWCLRDGIIYGMFIACSWHLYGEFPSWFSPVPYWIPTGSGRLAALQDQALRQRPCTAVMAGGWLLAQRWEKLGTRWQWLPLVI